MERLLTKGETKELIINEMLNRKIKREEKKAIYKAAEEKVLSEGGNNSEKLFSNYTPIIGASQKDYNERRMQRNGNMPQFGSYDYFVQREKEIGSMLDDIEENRTWGSDDEEIVRAYWNGSKIIDKNDIVVRDHEDAIRYYDKVREEYKAISKYLDKFNKENNEVKLKRTGEVDIEAGVENARDKEKRAERQMYASGMPIYKIEGGFEGEGTEKENLDYARKSLSKAILADATADAYEYYGENKDNKYGDNFIGRAIGNYKLGRIGIKTNEAGYKSLVSGTDDIEGAQVYQLLSEKIYNNNKRNFENGNKTWANLWQYAPQAVDQALYSTAGRIYGTAAGFLTGTPSAGGRAGAAAASAIYMYRQTAGGAYVRLLQEAKLPIEDAKVLAENEAVLSAVIEFGLEYGLGGLWKGGKAVKGTIANKATEEAVEGIGEKLVKKLTSLGMKETSAKTAVKIAKTAGKLGVEAVGEGTEEGLQEAVSIATDRVAKNQGSGSKGDILKETVNFSAYTDKELAQIWESAKAGAALSGIGAGVKLGSNKIINKIIGEPAESENKTIRRLKAKVLPHFNDGVNQQTIDEYVDKAYNKENENDYIKYSKVSEKLSADVKGEIDISEYSHALRDNDIRHIKNSHGENTNEKYPVTKDDIKAIPTIVENYDKVFVFKKDEKHNGIVYVKVSNDGQVYYLEQVTTKYGNEKLLVNKQMIKTGIDDIPDIKGLKDAINKKQNVNEFLADLEKARQVYAQSVYQSHPKDNISHHGEKVKVSGVELGENGKRIFSTIKPSGDAESFNKTVSEYYKLGLEGIGFDKAREIIGDNPSTADAVSLPQDKGGISEIDARRIHNAGMKDGARKRNGGVVASSEIRKRVGNKTVDALDKIAKKLHLIIDFAETLGSDNGFYKDGRITIALDADMPCVIVASHEITHHIKETASKEVWNKFQDMAVAYEAKKADMAADELIRGKIKLYKANGKNINKEDAMEEIAADFTSEVFKDDNELEAFLEKMANKSRENRTVIKKFFDSIKEVLRKISDLIPHSDKVTLENAIERFEKAYNSAVENTAQGKKPNSGAVKYDVKMDFKHQVDASLDGKLKHTLSVFVGRVPNLLTKCGLDAELPMLMNQSHLRDIMHPKSDKNIHWHGLSRDVIKRIPDQLKNPVMIYDSISEGNSENAVCVVTNLKDSDGLPIIISIRANSEANNKYLDVSLNEIKTNKSNFVTSAYGKDNFFNHLNEVIEKDALLFANKNKTLKLFSQKGLQLPERLNNLGFDNIIHQSRNIVNSNSMQKKENYSQEGKSSVKGASNSDIAERRRMDAENQRVEELYRVVDEQNINSEGIETLTDSFMFYTSATAEKGKLMKDFSELLNMIKSKRDFSDIKDKALEIARELTESASALNDGDYIRYKDLRNFIRKERIAITDEIKQEFSGEFESFRKSNMGSMLFSYEGRGIDEIYEELSNDYPEFFDYETERGPKEQLEKISEVLQSLKPTYENPYASDMDFATEEIANSILEDIAEGKAESRKEKQRRARVDKAILKEKEKREKQVKAVREYYLERIDKDNERRQKSLVVSKIRNAEKRVTNKLVNPTNSRHIPEELKNPSKSLLDIIGSLSGNGNGKEGIFVSVQNALSAVEVAYSKIFEEASKSETYRIGGAIIWGSIVLDENCLENISECSEMIKNNIEYADKKFLNLSDLDLKTVKKLYSCIRDMEQMILNSNKLIGSHLDSGVFETSEDIIKENTTERNSTVSFDVIDKISSYTTEKTLSPETFFHKIGKTAEKLYKEVRDASSKEVRNLNKLLEACGEIKKVLGEKGSLKDLLDKNAKKILFRTENGEMIRLNKMHIISLYLLDKQTGPRGARNNIYGGGIVIRGSENKIGTGKADGDTPGIAVSDIMRFLGAKDKMGKPVKVTEKDMASLFKLLSEEDIAVAEKMSEFMKKFATWGNEVSLELFGYKKYEMKNYWPREIYRIEQGGQDVKKARNIENIRAGITRKENSQPIVIDNAFYTFVKYGREMGYHNAYALPMVNFKRVMNFSEGNTSVRETINSKFNKGTSKTIDFFIQMVNGGAADDIMNIPFIDEALSNFKKGVIGFKDTVAMKQPASGFRAMSELDLRSWGNPMNLLPADVKAMEKYAPITQWKDWGFYGDNIAPGIMQLVGGGNMKSKISDAGMFLPSLMDKWTWRRIWNACIHQIKREYKGQLQYGTEKFYAKTAELFNDVIYRTQVVDSMFQKPMIMSGKVVNQALTAFQNEPLTNYNAIFRTLIDLRNKEAGAKSRFVKTAFALVLQAAWTGVVVPKISKWLLSGLLSKTDDEEEKSNKERIKEMGVAIAGEMFSLGPITNILSNIAETRYGGTERMELQAINDFVEIIKKVDEGKFTGEGAFVKVIGSAAHVMGQPVSGIKKDLQIMVSLFAKFSGNNESVYIGEYELCKKLYDVKYASNEKMFKELLFKAYTTGNENVYKYIEKDLMIENPKKFNAATISEYMKDKAEKYVETHPEFKAGFKTRWNINVPLREVEEAEPEKDKEEIIRELSYEQKENFEEKYIDILERVVNSVTGEADALDDAEYNRLVNGVTKYAEEVALYDVTNGDYVPSAKWILECRDNAEEIGMSEAEYIYLRSYFQNLEPVRNEYSDKVIKNKPDLLRKHMSERGYSYITFKKFYDMVK